MNIQIFGKAKCQQTKKAQRYFKERRVPFHYVDILKKGLSPGEYASVKKAVGGASLIDANSRAYKESFIEYLDAQEMIEEEKLQENLELYITPIVRRGKEATLGYAPEVWENWLAK